MTFAQMAIFEERYISTYYFACVQKLSYISLQEFMDHSLSWNWPPYYSVYCTHAY